ncbi:MAG TPA: potassium transporter KtrB [Lachnospiraceae bacterium]|nr:potassium transporter KtrB [Lachnospiraceae bacterium]
MNALDKINRELSTTQVIALGFLSAILIGAVILSLPVSSADGTFTPFVDSLFTSATSVCVTGLVVVTTATHWSLFGKIIIIILIQLGGLGIISFTTGIMMVIGRRITLRDRMLLEDALNLDTLTGLVKFLRRVFKGTFIVESMGALGYSFVFIPEYGFIRGIWYSVFHSISAFCNAGIDILGENSFVPYVLNPWINIVTMCLIVAGSIGFIVWWDITANVKKLASHEYTLKMALRRLHLHSKISIITTLCLIFGGAVFIFILEYNNTATIGNMGIAGKIMASLFQSVVLRTAGFMTFSQAGLRSTTVLVCLFLMFIGGSSIGTAGGIKTTTFALLFLSTRATIKGQPHIVVFNKTIPHKTVQKALAVTFVSLLVLILATFVLQIAEGGLLLDAAFETTSAIATVGLSRDFTASLNFAGKLIIIICMYLGRIGPISMAIFFNRQQGNNIYCSYPHEDITVG